MSDKPRLIRKERGFCQIILREDVIGCYFDQCFQIHVSNFFSGRDISRFRRMHWIGTSKPSQLKNVY